jgi:XTP/dITP diphosphohydrolase
MTTREVFLASGNAHKAAELAALAETAGLGWTMASARALGGMPEVVEDMGTFEGNARKKAWALRAIAPAGAAVLADDSGLCVEALGGAPGVESAYYAGPAGDAAANLTKLVKTMRGVPAAKRRAAFVCVLVWLGPGGEEYIFEGRCEGRLLETPQGEAGFGYDPLFAPEGYAASFAQLGDVVKHTLSHRGRAWARLVEWARGQTTTFSTTIGH